MKRDPNAANHHNRNLTPRLKQFKSRRKPGIDQEIEPKDSSFEGSRELIAGASRTKQNPGELEDWSPARPKRR
jgi:hypothetical protein